MVTAALHGIFLGTAVVLVAFGAVKVTLSRVAPEGPGTAGWPTLTRLLTVHENFPRLVGAAEVVCGALALLFAQSRWPAVIVTGLGAAFVGVLVVRLQVMPASGCGCIRAANKEPYLALSSVLRSAAMCAGGLCGLIAQGHLLISGETVLAGGVWLLVLAALSPETWQYMNVRCGRPLVFAVRDDRRRLERSPGYQRLRKGGLIAKRPSDVWSEGCMRYFVFLVSEDRDERQVATFQVGPSGVLGRVVSRPSPAAPAITVPSESSVPIGQVPSPS
jgi:hypothetical protein